MYNQQLLARKLVMPKRASVARISVVRSTVCGKETISPIRAYTVGSGTKRNQSVISVNQKNGWNLHSKKVEYTKEKYPIISPYVFLVIESTTHTRRGIKVTRQCTQRSANSVVSHLTEQRKRAVSVQTRALESGEWLALNSNPSTVKEEK